MPKRKAEGEANARGVEGAPLPTRRLARRAPNATPCHAADALVGAKVLVPQSVWPDFPLPKNSKGWKGTVIGVRRQSPLEYFVKFVDDPQKYFFAASLIARWRVKPAAAPASPASLVSPPRQPALSVSTGADTATPARKKAKGGKVGGHAAPAATPQAAPAASPQRGAAGRLQAKKAALLGRISALTSLAQLDKVEAALHGII
eukprot:scaffold21.g2146.t1